jgi:DNA-directed RNA polymerase subunit RPC12/RpoP
MSIIPSYIDKCPYCGSINLGWSDGGLSVYYCRNCGKPIDLFGPVFGGATLDEDSL